MPPRPSSGEGPPRRDAIHRRARVPPVARGVLGGIAGLAGISNGEMIRRAIDAGFDVIVTLDRGIPHQQNLERFGIGFVLIPHNDVDRIRPYADDLRRAVEQASPGLVLRVPAPR